MPPTSNITPKPRAHNQVGVPLWSEIEPVSGVGSGPAVDGGGGEEGVAVEVKVGLTEGDGEAGVGVGKGEEGKVLSALASPGVSVDTSDSRPV